MADELWVEIVMLIQSWNQDNTSIDPSKLYITSDESVGESTWKTDVDSLCDTVVNGGYYTCAKLAKCIVLQNDVTITGPMKLAEVMAF